MAKKRRQILKAAISFLSLCPKGANNIHTVYKSDDGKNHNIELATAVGKLSDEGELTAVVYAPDMVDSQGDSASAKVIKQFAHDFGANGRGIDVRHNEDVLDVAKAFVAESFIIQKNDPRFSSMEDYEGNSVDVTGGWGVVLKINDEELRQQYRDGEWGGISMGGLMAARDVSDDSGVLQKLSKMIEGLVNKTNNSSKSTSNLENKMNEKEIKELVAKAAAEAVTEALAEVEKVKKEEAEKLAKEKKAEKKTGLGYTEPVLKADASDAELDVHLRKLEIFKMSEKVDSKDSVAIRQFRIDARKIATCENLETEVAKQHTDQMSSFFVTNQGAGDITNTVANKGGDSDPFGENILKEYEVIRKENLKAVS